VIWEPASGRPESGFWSSNHGGFFDGGSLQWFVAGVGRQVADFPNDFEAGRIGCASEGCVLAIEIGVSAEADEELGSAGVRVIGAGHGEHAGHVRSGVEFCFDGVTRATGACAERAATLNHKPIDDSVEHHTVVVTDASQSDEVGAVSRSHLGQQVQQNRAVVGAEFDLVGVFVVVDVLNGSVNFGFAIFAHVSLS
jgi:hypothetical protein